MLAWLQGVDELQLHLSADTIGEIQAGIELTREKDPAKADEIEKIFKTVKKLPKRSQWLSKKTRPVKAGPIAVPKKKTK